MSLKIEREEPLKRLAMAVESLDMNAIALGDRRPKDSIEIGRNVISALVQRSKYLLFFFFSANRFAKSACLDARSTMLEESGLMIVTSSAIGCDDVPSGMKISAGVFFEATLSNGCSNLGDHAAR